jgi:hypothetical protein
MGDYDINLQDNLAIKWRDVENISKHMDRIVELNRDRREERETEWLRTKGYVLDPKQNWSDQELKENQRLIHLDDYLNTSSSEEGELEPTFGVNRMKGTYQARVSEEQVAKVNWIPVLPDGLDPDSAESLTAMFTNLLKATFTENKAVNWERKRRKAKAARNIYSETLLWVYLQEKSEGTWMLKDGGTPVVGMKRMGEGSWQDGKGMPVPMSPTMEEKFYPQYEFGLKVIYPYQYWSDAQEDFFDAHEYLICESVRRNDVVSILTRQVDQTEDGTPIYEGSKLIWGQEEPLDISQIKESEDPSRESFSLFGGGSEQRRQVEPMIRRWTYMRLPDRDFPEGLMAVRYGSKEITHVGKLLTGQAGLFPYQDIPIPDEPGCQADLAFAVPVANYINRTLRKLAVGAQNSGMIGYMPCDDSGTPLVSKMPEMKGGEFINFIAIGPNAVRPPDAQEFKGISHEVLGFFELLKAEYQVQVQRMDSSPGGRATELKTATQTGMQLQEQKDVRGDLHRRDAETEKMILNYWLTCVTNQALFPEPQTASLKADGRIAELTWDATTLQMVKEIDFDEKSVLPRSESRDTQNALLLLETAPDPFSKMSAYQHLQEVVGVTLPPPPPQAMMPPGPPGMPPQPMGSEKALPIQPPAPTGPIGGV